MRAIRAIVWIGTVLLFSSCTTDYVTGKKTFSLVSESQEIEMGKEADPQIVAEYGLYDDEALGKFVADLGQRLAKRSQRPQLAYTFRVLDSPIINAFALPGGYVYVTRGILAHFNSEDELAGVLGHEIGHVVARHGAEQISRQQLAGLGLGLGAALSETFAKYADTAGLGVGLLFLKFSRTQESESDMLGVEYSTRLGYNAHHMAEFFQTLKAMSDASGQSLPSFLSTHPDPGDREARVNELANEWQAKVAFEPLNLDPNAYLRRIDGIVYGADPRQGYVEGQTFYHPAMKFQFPIPSGWKVVNTPASVQMASADGKALIQLSMAKGATPAAAADAFIDQYSAAVKRRDATTVHGFPAAVVESELTTQDGTLAVLAYFIKKDAQVFAMYGITTPDEYPGRGSQFTAVMTGFAPVTDPAVLGKKPRRLKIVSAPTSGTMASVLRALGAGDDMLSELAVLNGRAREAQVRSGELIKIVQ